MKYFIYCRKSSRAEDRQVMSIDSQRNELQRVFGVREDIEIVGIFEESMSAQAPGRPKFAQMLAAIEQGVADGIMAWAPDRLARNSIDGGSIVYMLDRGLIKDLKFSTYTFENNSQGKFMLQIMFGQSKYYSDALSENVRRGIRNKLALGWRPNQATFGYTNDPVGKTIVPDAERFPFVRKMYELALSGVYSGRQITKIAQEEWGLRTPKKTRMGGVLVGTATVHRILTNPFYAGIIVWQGQRYQGKHQPVVSIEEFEAVQRMLRRATRPRPSTRRFAYTGMMRCGNCNLMVTAEHRVNQYGSHYTYYHCTRRMLGPRCSEPSVQVGPLEDQLLDFLETLYIEPGIEAWILNRLERLRRSQANDLSARSQSLTQSLAGVESELRQLTGLRLRQLLTDEEFTAERERLQTEALKLNVKLAENGKQDRFEPLCEVVSFSVLAAIWFWRAGDDERRLIVQTGGSNFSLATKKVSIDAAKPFMALSKMIDCLDLRRVRDDVRTNGATASQHCTRAPQRISDAKLKAHLDAIRTALDAPECEHILKNIRALRAQLGTDKRDAA